MAKRNKLRNTRPQADFGLALLSGLTGVLGNVITTGMQSQAAKEAAELQAEAIRNAAESNAKALQLQNENNTALQKESIAFTKEQNDINRRMYENVQRNLLLQQNRENLNTIKDAAKIQLKNGGSMRRKLRNANVNNPSFLRGRDNLPFTVTDGGNVIPIAVTPEGYDLYEIVGNDHNHYHKTKNGKNETGVGIKFAGNRTVEGEGNQNTNQGELMLVTPDDAKFISKHSIKGFNPTKAVLSGVHPIDAFNIQEEIKKENNIHNNTSPVRNNKKLRCGGRHKADLGMNYNDMYNYSLTNNPYSWGFSNNGYGRNRGRLSNPYFTNILGAGINTAGNLLGAFITSSGNNIASNILANAYTNAGENLANAYSQLHGVDINSINPDDFNPGYSIAALQAPVVNTGAQRSAAERSLHRNLARINRNTLSSAAAQNRSARAEIDYNDMISTIEDNADKLRQDIIQNNMQRITQVSADNANRQAEGRRAYANAYLNLLQYNNDIENEKITGAAQARADALLQRASTLAGTRQANASSYAGAISQSGLGFANTLNTNAKLRNELEMTMLGASAENQYNYYLLHPYAPGFEEFAERFKNADGVYKNWYNNLINARNK